MESRALIKNGAQALPEAPGGSQAASLGALANQAAAQAAFFEYTSRLATNTLRRQARDLISFGDFLTEHGLEPGDLGADPSAWQVVTWGLVAAWKMWLLNLGYAVATVNQRISTVKVYAGLANQAGALSTEELLKIRGVRGYSRREIRRVDEKRKAAGSPTRLGAKKAEPVTLTPEQAAQLKGQPEDTPQGRRDRLLMCLLLDHGLRCGEVVLLKVEHFHSRGKMTFYRPKVDRVQTHKLSKDTAAALAAYLALDQRAKSGPLLLGSRRNGSLAGTMGERAITARVDYLGEQIGVAGLSAHDCRHDWATQASRHHTPLERLQDAGGWASLAMPARYIEASAVANDGVRLGEDD